MSLILDGTNGLSDVDGSAATPAIRGSDANTGIFFPGADRIGFAEGGVQVGEFDASGNFLMNSGYGSVAIRASGNVSSITDVGTGQYTVNLTTAMPDVNYATVASGAKAISGDDGNNSVAIGGISRVPTTTTVPITNFTESIGQTDNAYIYVSIFR